MLNQKFYVRNILLVYLVALPVGYLTFVLVQLGAGLLLDPQSLRDPAWLLVGLVWGNVPHFILFGPLYSLVHTALLLRCAQRFGHRVGTVSVVLAGGLSILGTLALALRVGVVTWFLFGPTFIVGMLAYGWVVGKNPLKHLGR